MTKSQLYRCYLIWATSSYARIVVAIPLIMILATAGNWLPIFLCIQLEHSLIPL
jgi:hypothetical protein